MKYNEQFTPVTPPPLKTNGAFLRYKPDVQKITRTPPPLIYITKTTVNHAACACLVTQLLSLSQTRTHRLLYTLKAPKLCHGKKIQQLRFPRNSIKLLTYCAHVLKRAKYPHLKPTTGPIYARPILYLLRNRGGRCMPSCSCCTVERIGINTNEGSLVPWLSFLAAASV